MTIGNLKKSIISKINSVDGDFAVAFVDLNNVGNKILINSDEQFHPASTIKTPVMMEVFHQIEEGRFSLNDSILVENNFTSIADGSNFSLQIDRDSGEDFYKYIGKKRTILQLLENMITISGNLSANILIEIVKAENITRYMRSLGAENIYVLRGVEDIKAFNLGINNRATARDLMIIYQKLAEGKIVSEKYSKKMIDILLRQRFNEIIPALLPANVKVAHKTGSISGVCHDSGIVFLPNGKKYVLILFSKNLKNENDGIKIEAEISRMIYYFEINN